MVNNMDMNIINELIDELENAETSLSNIRNLSALYNVKSHILGTQNYDSTTKELSDILPSYLKYIDTKRKFQLHEVTDDAVYITMKELCKEIKEFMHSLYSGTDTPKERELLQQLIKEIQ